MMAQEAVGIASCGLCLSVHGIGKLHLRESDQRTGQKDERVQLCPPMANTTLTLRIWLLPVSRKAAA